MITAQPVNTLTEIIADDTHCAAGAVVALSAALAAALARATANGTLLEYTRNPSETEAAMESIEASKAFQELMTSIRTRLLAIADEDAQAIGEFVRLRDTGQQLQGYQLLCDGPKEVAMLAIDAAQAMQDYRAQVCERTRDDLEFAITLMAGAAKGAMQLLDSNLRIWPLPALVAQYDATVRELTATIAQLTPVNRIRTA